MGIEIEGKKVPAFTTYRNTKYHQYGDKCTWQMAPEQGVLVNADTSDSQQRRERGAKTVGNISTGMVITIKRCLSGEACDLKGYFIL